MSYKQLEWCQVQYDTLCQVIKEFYLRGITVFPMPYLANPRRRRGTGIRIGRGEYVQRFLERFGPLDISQHRFSFILNKRSQSMAATHF